jgi:hypothetical protein
MRKPGTVFLTTINVLANTHCEPTDRFVLAHYQNLNTPSNRPRSLNPVIREVLDNFREDRQ